MVIRMCLLIAVLQTVSFTTAHARDLDSLLAGMARSTEIFWRQFTAVSCTETVTQRKLGNKGKIMHQRESAFDYLIVMNAEEDGLLVEESRLLQKATGKPKEQALLITNGFPTLSLVFHPYYQGSFEYLLEGEEIVEGRVLVRLGFLQIAGARSTAALRLRGREFPLELKGTAWVDPLTATVVKIEAGLKTPLGELGLEALDCAVRYAPVPFPDLNDTYWLPQEARVEARTRHQHWENTHRFGGYRHFTVKSETAVQQ